MRMQNLQASAMTAFTRTSHYSDISYQKSASKKLIEASDNTNTFLEIVSELAKQIYHPKYKLAKAGILLHNLTNSNCLQQSIEKWSLRNKSAPLKGKELMATIDSINRRFKVEAITWGIAKKKCKWSMNRNLLSGTSTTNIKEIPTIVI